jgi:TRAP-type mannitol/chloroaromatic compound transport system permease small subunit
MNSCLTAIDRTGRLLAALAMLCLLVLIVDMVYEVVSRRLFSAPTLWAYDVAYMVNGVAFVFAAGYTLKNEGHIRIDFLAQRLRRQTQDRINVAAYVLLVIPAFAFLLIGAFDAWYEALVNDEVDPASPWKPLLWPFYAGLVLGFAGLILQAGAQCVRHARAAAGAGPSPLLALEPGETAAEEDRHG